MPSLFLQEILDLGTLGAVPERNGVLVAGDQFQPQDIALAVGQGKGLQPEKPGAAPNVGGS